MSAQCTSMMVSSQLPCAVFHSPCSTSLDARDGVALGGEPALAGEIGRQHLVLELVLGGGGDGAAHRAGTGPAAREGQPAFGQHQHRQFGPRQAFFVPVRYFDVGGEAEAVGAVALERQQVGQVADRRKGGAARAVRPAPGP